MCQSIRTYTKDDAYQTLGIINSWISNIDAKVSFALALVGILIGAIFCKGVPNALKRVIESNLKNVSGGDVIGVIFVILLYFVSFISVICFMSAIIARIKNPNHSQSVYFFGSIASKNIVDYKSRVNQITEDEIVDDLVEQIHTNSMICSKKAKCYNWGIRFLLGTIVLWYICMIFQFI